MTSATYAGVQQRKKSYCGLWLITTPDLFALTARTLSTCNDVTRQSSLRSNLKKKAGNTNGSSNLGPDRRRPRRHCGQAIQLDRPGQVKPNLSRSIRHEAKQGRAKHAGCVPSLPLPCLWSHPLLGNEVAPTPFQCHQAAFLSEVRGKNHNFRASSRGVSLPLYPKQPKCTSAYCTLRKTRHRVEA